MTATFRITFRDRKITMTLTFRTTHRDSKNTVIFKATSWKNRKKKMGVSHQLWSVSTSTSRKKTRLRKI